MYNHDRDWDKGFKRGMEIGQKIGFFEAKIQSVSLELTDIATTMSSNDEYSGIVMQIEDCVERLDNATDQITDL